MQLVLPPFLGVTVLLGISAGALLKGGLEERIAAAGLLADVAVTVLWRDHTVGNLEPHLQWAGFAADLLLLVLFFGVALRSRKYWPLAATAFQLLMVLTHVGKLLDPSVNRWAYFTAIIIWSYALFIVLGVGVWNNWRTERHLRAGPGLATTEARQ